MALKRLKNGQYRIETKKQAVEALEESGIVEMQMDTVELKKAVTAFMAEKNAQALEIPKAGKVAKLIMGFDGTWIETRRDALAANLPAGVRNLKSIVAGKTVKLNNGRKTTLWNYITKRVLDPDKLAEAVATGAVDEDEIKDAYYEKPRAPYVRIYDE
jgi:hypothetical protein